MELLLLALAFWPMLIAMAALAGVGAWAPRHYWFRQGRPPRLQNILMLLLALWSGFMLYRGLMAGSVCATIRCRQIYHAGDAGEAALYWHVIGITALLGLFGLWGALAGEAGREAVAPPSAEELARQERVRAQIKLAWDETGGSAAFVTRLRENGLHCARDAGGMFVVVDEAGGVHALAFDTMQDGKAAIIDTLEAALQGSAVTVPELAALRAQMAAKAD